MHDGGFLAALGALLAERRPSAEARDEAALCLVDTLACILAGRDEEVARATRRAMAAAAGDGPARAIGTAVRMPVPAAALANGVAAHAIDLDDYEIPGSTHPSAVILGALLALATARAASLGEVLAAHVAGHEAIVRVGEALGHGHYLAGWHATSTIGPFGAAAACARLLGLGASATAQALGLAASASAGLKHQFGSDAKPVHAGFAARAGLEAALLAAEGVGAAPLLFEGARGFLALYGTPSSPGPAAGLARDPGRDGILVHRPLRKPWPCCAYAHRAIEATQRIVAAHGLARDDVLRGTIRMPAPHAAVVAAPDPRTPSEARFSATWCVAATLHDGEPGPASFSPVALARPETRDLMRRLRLEPYEPRPGLGDMSPLAPDEVELELRDGRRVAATVDEVLGSAARPLPKSRVVGKLLAAGGSASHAEALLQGARGTPVTELLP